jgi:hypothetical protein
MSRRVVTAALAIILALGVAAGAVALGQRLEWKPTAEGAGGLSAGRAVAPTPAKAGREEGEGGSSGRAPLDQSAARTDTAPDAAILLYLFSGVADDGSRGGALRLEATSVHCTNVGTLGAQIEVQFFNFTPTVVYTATAYAEPGRTLTFSSQDTAIYYDDVYVGGDDGTDPIYQGHGRILAGHAQVICTAQVLDARNSPPGFATTLTLFRASDYIVLGELYVPFALSQ